jgi:hypothetical protein
VHGIRHAGSTAMTISVTRTFSGVSCTNQGQSP